MAAYLVKDRIIRNGETLEAGDKVDLNDKEAAPLRQLKVIEPAKGAKPTDEEEDKSKKS